MISNHFNEKILVCCFNEFDNRQENFSALVLSNLHNHNIKKIFLDVSYDNSFTLVKKAIDENHFQTIILLGEARSYSLIKCEKYARNITSLKSDVNNNVLSTPYILKKGKYILKSSLQYSKLIKFFKLQNLYPKISFNAGNYLCNYIFYKTLNYIKDTKLKCKVGFIHFPILTQEQINACASALDKYINSVLI